MNISIKKALSILDPEDIITIIEAGKWALDRTHENGLGDHLDLADEHLDELREITEQLLNPPQVAFEYRVKVKDALDWNIKKDGHASLAHALIADATKAWEQAEPEAGDGDIESTLTTEGDDFVVRFYVNEDEEEED